MPHSLANFLLSVALTLAMLLSPAPARADVPQVIDVPESTITKRANPVPRSRIAVPEPSPPPAAAPAEGAAPRPAPPPVPTVADARAYAARQVGAAQFACLDALWQHESNWNPHARNPSSGAYGIPQALPAGKMASFGADWAQNPITQVRWGLWYISASYRTPCGAWAFWKAHYPHWY